MVGPVVRTGQFPIQWVRGVSKEGPKQDPANYLSVCVLSNVRKAVDAAFLPMMNGHFVPARSQFGFQQWIAVTQALLWDVDNARKSMCHAAVFDLDKAYDKVERRLILQVVTKWLHARTTSIVSALLGPMQS